MEIYLIDEANNYTFRYPVAPLNEIKITEKHIDSRRITAVI